MAPSEYYRHTFTRCQPSTPGIVFTRYRILSNTAHRHCKSYIYPFHIPCPCTPCNQTFKFEESHACCKSDAVKHGLSYDTKSHSSIQSWRLISDFEIQYLWWARARASVRSSYILQCWSCSFVRFNSKPPFSRVLRDCCIVIYPIIEKSYNA